MNFSLSIGQFLILPEICFLMQSEQNMWPHGNTNYLGFLSQDEQDTYFFIRSSSSFKNSISLSFENCRPPYAPSILCYCDLRSCFFLSSASFWILIFSFSLSLPFSKIKSSIDYFCFFSVSLFYSIFTENCFLSESIFYYEFWIFICSFWKKVWISFC